MQSVFREIIKFEVTIKPEIERQIHMFSAGGGQTGEIQIFVDAFFKDVVYEPPFEESQKVPLGLIALVLKFPEWLANAEYQDNYESFTGKLAELGLQIDDSLMREVTTYTDLDRASLIREAIKKLDLIHEAARQLLEKKSEEKKK